MKQNIQLTRAPAKLDARKQQVKLYLEAQKKKDSIQSLIVAAVVISIVCAILALVAIIPQFRDAPVIVTYQAPVVEEEQPERPQDMARGLKPKPANSSSGMARTIASSTPADLAVPVPEEVDPTRPFGLDDDFNAGFGAGDGDGDGGGGSSFFGTKRTGKRVVYIVDFSLSMESACTGGTRIQMLKKELINSINALTDKMSFNVIYFSHNAWTNATPGPNQADKGWNGLGEVPMVDWYPATNEFKADCISKINATPAQGNTGWYSPLKIAFSMTPAPDIVYLLSDGEARDSNIVFDELVKMNPTAIPIDTIAFELPGTPAYDLNEIAKKTGGKFALYYEGKRYIGESAEKYFGTEYDQ